MARAAAVLDGFSWSRGRGGGGGSCRRGSTVYCYDKYVSIMFDLSSFINVCTYIV